MSERDPDSKLTRARLAMFRVYAALDDVAPRNAVDPDDDEDVRGRKGAGVKLADAVRDVLGIDLGPLDPPEEELRGLVDEVVAERSSDASDSVSGPSAPGGPTPIASPPMVPLVRVAEAAMDVAAVAGAIPDDTRAAVARLLVTDEAATGRVEAALQVSELVPPGGREDAWAQLQGPDGSDIHPDLRGVRVSGCDEQLIQHRSEYVTKIDTDFVIDQGEHRMDDLAAACMPERWSNCNDFFCSVVYAAERSRLRDGTTAPVPAAASESWRGVYEERVLRCPDGAFPNTFLDFEWRRRPSQLVVTYRLALGLEEACDLKIDQGHIMVSFLGTQIRVQTRKWLLFDDRRRPSGGQTLALYACRLGWMDYSITQFTTCAKQKSLLSLPTHGAPARRAPSAQERLVALVARAEEQLRHCGTSSAGELDEILNKLKSEAINTDEYVGRLAKLASRQLERDGAALIQGATDYALTSFDVLQEFAANWRRTRV
jgi:hypothetical protein